MEAAERDINSAEPLPDSHYEAVARIFKSSNYRKDLTEKCKTKLKNLFLEYSAKRRKNVGQPDLSDSLISN